MSSRVSRSSGITLIELLLALFIATVAAVAVFGLFLSQSRGMRQSQESMEIHDNLRVALDVIARDIRSAGFMTGDNGSLGFALRVENNCGNSSTGGATGSTGVNFDATTNTLSVPSTTLGAIDDEGNVVKTLQPDGCPNGSDRLTVVYRQRTDFIQMTGSNSGNNQKLVFPCGPFGTCGAALAGMGVQGVCNDVMSAPVSVCAANDPNRCYTVTFNSDGTGNCPCAGTGNCMLDIFEYPSGNPFNSVTGVWIPALCPDPTTCTNSDRLDAKRNASIGAWITHSYQIMDLDGDGSTELVSSADQASFTTRTTAAADATFDVVANYIDDLQVAVSYRKGPDGVAGNGDDETFVSANLWNIPTCTPSAAAPAAAGPDNCLFPLVSNPGTNNPPTAVRVTLVARSAKRRLSDSGTVENSSRPQVEDNNPPFDPYDPTGTITPGAAICYGTENCGCGTATLPGLVSCSTTGNAAGYARRIITETIGIRNLSTVAN